MLRQCPDEEQVMELMSESGVDGALQQLGKSFPTVLATLVEERDQFLAASLRDAALEAARASGRRLANRSRNMVEDSGKDIRRTCSMCGQEFPSRSAMFRHLKERGRHSDVEDTSLPRVTLVG